MYMYPAVHSLERTSKLKIYKVVIKIYCYQTVYEEKYSHHRVFIITISTITSIIILRKVAIYGDIISERTACTAGDAL